MTIEFTHGAGAEEWTDRRRHLMEWWLPWLLGKHGVKSVRANLANALGRDVIEIEYVFGGKVQEAWFGFSHFEQIARMIELEEMTKEKE